MNKKGFTLGITILSALFILLVGLTIVNILMPQINDFRGEMSCASVNDITDGVKILCLIGDATIPMWIIGVLILAIGGITARFVF